MKDISPHQIPFKKNLSQVYLNINVQVSVDNLRGVIHEISHSSVMLWIKLSSKNKHLGELFSVFSKYFGFILLFHIFHRSLLSPVSPWIYWKSAH